MRTTLPEIHEPLDELERRLRAERNAQLKSRLHLLVLIASNQVSSRHEAAQHLALHRNTVCRWLRVYQREGLAGLLTLGEPGAPSGSARLTPVIAEALQQRLNDPSGFARYGEVQRWLDEEYDQQIPYSTAMILRPSLSARGRNIQKKHCRGSRFCQPPRSVCKPAPGHGVATSTASVLSG